ncbi:MAG: hypothetical protein ACLFST_10495 [Spirochaetia bacterium]
MKNTILLILIGLLVLLLAGCTPDANPMVGTGDEEGDVSGFLPGLWHGIIAPVTFVISLFSDNISMYDVHNNGGWYNFGFLIGLAGFWGGGGSAAGGAGRRRRRI